MGGLSSGVSNVPGLYLAIGNGRYRSVYKRRFEVCERNRRRYDDGLGLREKRSKIGERDCSGTLGSAGAFSTSAVVPCIRWWIVDFCDAGWFIKLVSFHRISDFVDPPLETRIYIKISDPRINDKILVAFKYLFVSWWHLELSLMTQTRRYYSFNLSLINMSNIL